MLTNCKHPNIVSLLGICEEGPERILVYEHVSNGSLSDYFEKSNNTKRLSWAQRLQICLDIAHGLEYLHSNTEEKPMIVHRDIKSDNILLDNNWVAKIADFGLSRLRPANQKANTINTCTIAGTEVYLDPEYMETGKLRKESDIYSFGVVLFEVVSGKLAYDKSYSIKNEKGLLSIVHKCFKEKTLKKVIDPILRDASEGILIDGLVKKSMDTFFDIAYQCLADTQARRPTMKVIISELVKALNYQENDFHISLKDITLATKNFCDEKCIGKGRYWKQYEGHIPLANRLTTVIVKRWDKNSSQAHHQYFRELIFFERKHKNIVAFVGLCKESGELIIVYEHVTNRSLNKHLDNMSLTWIKRLQICISIASGLKYIHERVGMIHRDIKSSNILLDADWEPKICNFELSSKNMESLKVEHATDNAYSSLGYLDPLHEKQGCLDARSDVYSLGVILMEILCGRLAWGEGCKDHSESLGPLAVRHYYENLNLYELVFEGIKEQFNSKSFTTFARIAVECLKEEDYLRPKASEVVTQLKKALEIQERWEKLRISLEDIKVGTDNFSDAKFIGEERYWKQYKGDIPHANGLTTVVVKRFDANCDEGRNQFIVESEALLGYEHENIIRLAGYCDEVNEKIIIYEHASNGRLSEHLKDTSLTWLKRLKICIDVATGLKFLHIGGEDVMIHRGIKSGSILIDGEWKAIISNLELLKSVPRCIIMEGKKWESYETEEEKEREWNKTYAYGSFGYIDPKCKDTDDMTRESDIYSLGVVLMEIFCGRLAWEEGCKDPSECLGPLGYEKGDVDELVFEGIEKQIHKKSLIRFIDIAIRCLDCKQSRRPRARVVIIELQKALKYQEDYETWEPKLPRDYKEILHTSKIDEMEKFKDIYDTLCKGFHLRDREVYFSLGVNGAKNYVISAAKFSYKSRWAQNWQRIPQSRFKKVAKMLTNLNIHIKMRTPRLSLDVNYVVHLVFKFCGKSSAKSVYVNLTYKMGSESFHAYFAIWRDEDWMKIELCRFLNHNEDTNFEVLLESFARSYCANDAIYVEGIEFEAIDNEDIEKTMAIEQQLPSYSEKRSGNDYKGGELFSLDEINKNKHLMLSAMEVLYNCSNRERFHSEPSAKSRFQEVIELLPQQVFGIKCKIDGRMLTPHTDYMCYLVFKLSEKCHGLHCPVRVRNVLQWKIKEIGLACFRPPNQWNAHETYWVPKRREDGWMEVRVWKFNSTSALRNDCIPMHLKLITYEGTMSGLIVSGLEIRPISKQKPCDAEHRPEKGAVNSLNELKRNTVIDDINPKGPK
ncbi:serine/threonine-protein kinase, active site protein [Tanacetum coccineum]|uniref:Serine/threonine-protein kinase, active site protein n=1 Tax=Tanacetum coccineum TaxID=301880 RepID=A0ABQ5A0N5_9ASTR